MIQMCVGHLQQAKSYLEVHEHREVWPPELHESVAIRASLAKFLSD